MHFVSAGTPRCGLASDSDARASSGEVLVASTCNEDHDDGLQPSACRDDNVVTGRRPDRAMEVLAPTTEVRPAAPAPTPLVPSAPIKAEEDARRFVHRSSARPPPWRLDSHVASGPRAPTRHTQLNLVWLLLAGAGALADPALVDAVIQADAGMRDCSWVTAKQHSPLNGEWWVQMPYEHAVALVTRECSRARRTARARRLAGVLCVAWVWPTWT